MLVLGAHDSFMEYHRVMMSPLALGLDALGIRAI